MGWATDMCPARFSGVGGTCYCLIAPLLQVLPPQVCLMNSLCEFLLRYSQTKLDQF